MKDRYWETKARKYVTAWKRFYNLSGDNEKIIIALAKALEKQNGFGYRAAKRELNKP